MKELFDTETDYERREGADTAGKTVYEFRPLQFCFVGPRGVGKSSLLASMYHEIEELRQIDNFYINSGDRHIKLRTKKKAIAKAMTKRAKSIK